MLFRSLFLIFIFLLVSIVGVIILRKKVTGTKRRLLGGLSIFGIAFFILFGDEIIGKMYLGYLCETKADVNVINSINLPVEHWNEDGSPKFLNSIGQMKSKELSKRFKWKVESESYIDTFIRIDKEKWMYVDKETNNNLATKVTYRRYYGWLNNFSPAPNVSEHCEAELIRKYGKDTYFKKYDQDNMEFMLKVFTR